MMGYRVDRTPSTGVSDVHLHLLYFDNVVHEHVKTLIANINIPITDNLPTTNGPTRTRENRHAPVSGELETGPGVHHFSVHVDK